MSKRHRARGRRRIKAGKRHEYVMWTAGAIKNIFRAFGNGTVELTVDWGGLDPQRYDPPGMATVEHALHDMVVMHRGERIGRADSMRFHDELPVILPAACYDDKDFDFVQGIGGEVIPVLRPR